MALKLYYDIISPPSRAVLMCAKAIDLDLNIIEMNVFSGDQYEPEFLKLNLLHTVPTLEDNGFVLSDSHAIMGYLVGKYANDTSLYPQDVQKRAIIDQILYFDSSVFFPRYLGARSSILIIKTVTEEHVRAVEEAYGYIEFFFQNNKYVAGYSLSIADFSIINSITNASHLVPLDEDTYPKITAWINRMKTFPYYKINHTGGVLFSTVLKNK